MFVHGVVVVHVELHHRDDAAKGADEAAEHAGFVHSPQDDLGVVRGEVYGAEYLGTTQIVTVTTRYGALKARVPASVSFRTGENVGLDFRPDTLSIFDKASGRAVRTTLHEGGAHG